MRAKLYELKQREQESVLNKEAGDKQKIEWGSQIRSYVLQPYIMVKDHRTAFVTNQVNNVMNGELDEFIMAYLKAQLAGTLGQNPAGDDLE